MGREGPEPPDSRRACGLFFSFSKVGSEEYAKSTKSTEEYAKSTKSTRARRPLEAPAPMLAAKVRIISGEECTLSDRGGGGFEGVTFKERNKRHPYEARVTLGGERQRSLGSYATAELAAVAIATAKREAREADLAHGFGCGTAGSAASGKRKWRDGYASLPSSALFAIPHDLSLARCMCVKWQFE